jgi:ligand-binding SRPBCC domain-containing protein
MKVHSIKEVQLLPLPVQKAWEFFVSPANLALITPPDLGFSITSEVPAEMYEGLIITYTVTPFVGIKANWVTEISHIQEPRFFVDEQRLGPYRLWHHQHIFKEHPTGTEMTDLVHYALPFGVAGSLFAPIVERRLAQIFSYRRKVLTDLFRAPLK